VIRNLTRVRVDWALGQPVELSATWSVEPAEVPEAAEAVDPSGRRLTRADILREPPPAAPAPEVEAIPTRRPL